jgi:ABC-type transport system involved in multi-copper enzyme maturation permease subunit
MSTARLPVIGGLQAGLRAWCWLVALSFRRLWWSMQTLVAVALVGLVAALVLLRGLWQGWEIVLFSKAILMNLYIGFILPILCLCVGTQSMGGDWEDRSLVWLLTRPLPRPLIYLAKYVAAIPWTLALTLGGWFLLGLLAGPQGRRAVLEFWPAVAWATLAYLSLFHLMGAWFRRSTVIGVVYAFVFEVIVGGMPGLVKRASIGFYSRCILYDQADQAGLARVNNRPGIVPDQRAFFLPVDGQTAVIVLALLAFGLLLLGMVVFARREYRDLT